MSSIDDIPLSVGIYEEMYRRWKENPASVDPSWISMFKEFDRKELSKLLPTDKKLSAATSNLEESKYKILRLKEAWRRFGHLEAAFNPLEIPEKGLVAELLASHYGINSDELDQILPGEEITANSLIKRFSSIYGSRIGFEFKGFTTPEVELWFEEKLENPNWLAAPTIHERQAILQDLYKSELLETFIHTKFTGQKRFSLEGCETLIPMLKQAVDVGSELGVEEIVIGMAHRGRLNVLSNILNKSFKEIFSEFDETYLPEGFAGSGDVKYHKGFERKTITAKGKKLVIHLSPNPSHLESVDPVVEGQVKGLQVHRYKENAKDQVLPILIHGDAAIAGQGVVYETLQMQGLEGYATGGTLHIIVNNQIGFTTLPKDSRSTLYCTDLAKAFGNPVIHVNVEDPESCVAVIKLALEYRQRFKRDIFIDLNGWRKYGHNESDEPSFTQPILYHLIKTKKPIKDTYKKALMKSGFLESAVAEEIEKVFKKALTEAKDAIIPTIQDQEISHWVEEVKTPPYIKTSVSLDLIKEIAEKTAMIPEGFKPHPKIIQLLADRKALLLGSEGAKDIDFATAEMLAFATLLWEGKTVRLAGQDVQRGTFSQRHAVLRETHTDKFYIPLANLKEDQGKFYIYNSHLSEFAALGFEYGYSVAVPEGLTIWEAQYGDFANGAQVITDQYLATSEQKWGRKSRLTLFLPHGYEGQGPEHSSARIERFLTLAGHDNLRICYPSLPHQLFHLLRRETLTKDPRPLIVFTPKANLRLPACTSPLSEFEKGEFKSVIDDPTPPKSPLRLVFCTGKIYFDLKAYGEKIKDETTALVRIEELYPLYTALIEAILNKYSGVEEILWVQEEPQNMGAWTYIAPHLEELSGRKLRYVGREISASTATGIYFFHKKELQAIFQGVFAKDQPTTYEITGQLKA